MAFCEVHDCECVDEACEAANACRDYPYARLQRWAQRLYVELESGIDLWNGGSVDELLREGLNAGFVEASETKPTGT